MLSKISRIVISSLLLVIVIYYHKEIVTIGLKFRLPFAFSMILPYVIEFFFVCSLLFQMYFRVLVNRPMWLRRVVALVILIGGCGIAFAFHPIYDGDFNNTYNEITLKGSNEDVFQEGLTLVVLPGCPFCHQRFGQLKFMSDIYPTLPISVMVAYKDTSEVEEYREMSKDYKNIRVGFFPESLLETLQIHQFPTLIYTKDSISPKSLKKWTNDGFGVGAWDYVLNAEGL